MKHSDFVHLHVHTHFSLLDSSLRHEALFKRASEFKMPAVAMTDHSNLFGALEFFQGAKNHGLKPIIGCEMYVAPESRHKKEKDPNHQLRDAAYHLLLLAKNEAGYKNLLEMVTRAYLEGFYYKPRIDKELLAAHADGLIALSCCNRGEIAHNLGKENLPRATKVAQQYMEIMGKDNFYLELQDHGQDWQKKTNRELIELGKKLGLPVVATNNCHYLEKSDFHAHEVLLCLQTGKTLDDQYRMRTDLLEEIIQNDLAAGRFPFCIVGNAGTVNTGAIDPLSELAALARKYSLWFHIDGAFGAFARNIPEYADTLAAIGEADSLAFDLHKWMSVPYEAGCVLIRDETAHRKAYEQTANYLIRHERQQGSGQFSFGDYGIELSRGFKALKVWMTLKHYGAFAFTALIKQNIAQARYLSESVQQHPQLELTAPTALNIVCFRYVRPGWPEEKTRAVNQEIMLRMREKGAAIVSATILKGRYTLRAAIVNHRSRMEDFDFLVEQVVRNGHELG